jgi:hypothetical protein
MEFIEPTIDAQPVLATAPLAGIDTCHTTEADTPDDIELVVLAVAATHSMTAVNVSSEAGGVAWAGASGPAIVKCVRLGISFAVLAHLRAIPAARRNRT